MNNPQIKNLPFIFGSQYYRAPTPEPDCWLEDHQKMQELGFNAVKYWVQWRWSHRTGDHFVFDNLDRLMGLAMVNGLQVTMNTIFDVAPHWLFEKYPDAKQVMCNGQVIQAYTVAHRQIGGHPGPCYNHPGARLEREKFLRTVVEHFRECPALSMWDVWNEPELSFPQRNPQVDTMACYCAHCQSGFLTWLQQKYQGLDNLNRVWGRNYETWQQVETPRNPHTLTDYIDWREFHISSMTVEARWRLQMVKDLDPGRVAYLHVVPNVMSIFNSVSCCADDFEMAESCDVFAATMNGGPVLAPQVLSAGRGKTCYNVESHLNFGMTNMHQRRLELDDLLKDWLPQIGLGIRGFLFWQYRPEVLGFEAPAWGVVGLDGEDRPITRAVAEFIHKIEPISQSLMNWLPSLAPIGIWKSRKNEIFHFCLHDNLDGLVQSVEGYIQALYWQNYAYRIIDGGMLARGELEGLKVLIMPSPYYLTEAEAASLDAWVRKGGVALVEAHLAGYNADTGRHSRVLPGCDLAAAWGIRELDSTSSYHLKLEKAEAFQGAATEDVQKAMQSFETSGGKFFPVRLHNGVIAWGAERYARLGGENLHPLGYFEADAPCLGYLEVGQGEVIYSGTNLGQGAQNGPAGLLHLLEAAARRAGVTPLVGMESRQRGQVRLDPIEDENGRVRCLVVQNRSKETKTVSTQLKAKGRGLFSGFAWDSEPGQRLTLPKEFIDLVVMEAEE